MDIHDVVAILSAEMGRQDFHVAGQTDQVHVPPPQLLDDFFVVFFLVLEKLGIYEKRLQAPVPRSLKPRRIFFIAEDQDDVGVDASVSHGIMKGHEVRPAAGNENGNPAPFFRADKHFFAHDPAL
jgi:hypothetical protein